MALLPALAATLLFAFTLATIKNVSALGSDLDLRFIVALHVDLDIVSLSQILTDVTSHLVNRIVSQREHDLEMT